MITRETAVKICNAYQEKENAEKLLVELEEQLLKNNEGVGLQLGVPSGNSSQRLFAVSPKLSKQIITEHVKKQDERLVELMMAALNEMCAVRYGFENVQVILVGAAGTGKTTLARALFKLFPDIQEILSCQERFGLLLHAQIESRP